MDRALLALLALPLNAALGGLILARLMRKPGTFLREIERKLNREHRSLKERETRGMVLVAAAIIACMIAGGIGNWLLGHNLRFVELVIVTLALPVRPTWDLAAAIRTSLYSGKIQAARDALAGTAWRHHALLDEYGLARAGIETLAMHFSEKILAPLFWYLLLGLPGLFLSKTLWLMQESWSSPGSTGGGFGRAARITQMVLHILPSRLGAVLWLTASVFLPSAKWSEAARDIAKGAASDTPQTLALRSAASVLRISLGGPTSIFAQAWIGNGPVRVSVFDLKRALFAFMMLCLLLFVLLGFLL